MDVKTFFQCWQDCLIGYDRNLTVLAVNEAAERRIGASAADVVGRPIAAALPHYAAALGALLASSFDAGRSGAVLQSAGFDAFVAVANARGDDGLLVIYRASDYTPVERDAGLRDQRQRGAEQAAA